MPGSERLPAEGGGKLTRLLDQLEREAYALFRWPEQASSFSVPLFYTVLRQWSAWRNGMPPTREHLGRGGQNPRLLRAFERLESAYNRAQRDGTGGRQLVETRAAFEARALGQAG